MELKKLLENALRDINALKTTLANELEKGGDIPFAYSKLRDVEKALKKAVDVVKRTS